MRSAQDAESLYTSRDRLYLAWMSLFRQEQAIKALLDHAGVLRPNIRMLDAGCGSGAATLAALQLLKERGWAHSVVDAFDVTAAMLDRFQANLTAGKAENVRLRQANVRTLDRQLPEDWTGYDLVVSTSMLEYVPRPELAHALAALRRRLSTSGSLLVVITRKNLASKLMIEWAWNANGYGATELRAAFSSAGFLNLAFDKFPPSYFWMNITNYVLVGQNH
jgi:cyclopropane fatty-acyl-phospholipid synthase-like methyltransferase